MTDVELQEPCVACKQLEAVFTAKDGDRLCKKCKQKPKCDGCKKRVGRVMCSIVEPKKSYCGPCTRKRSG